MRSWLVLSLLSLTACSGEIEPPVEPTGEEGLAGVYRGELFLDLRAYLGPLRVAHETCSTDIEFIVDEGAEDLITGYGDCGRLPDFGHVEVEVWGGEVEMPEVGGEYYSDPFTNEWVGWFLSDEELWARSAGKGPWEEYRVRWDAEMSAEWVEAL